MDKLELLEKEELTNREKEIYRTLRSNIEFTGIENKVIAITSVLPDDGKSTVSFHLAAAFAEADKKTLYIDADIRKSVFAIRYGVGNNHKGLSHLLSGQAAMQEVVYSTNKRSLFVVPTGVLPKNPTELLGNVRFKEALHALKGVFDYIIVDTPPLGSVIDAAVIAKNCDASCLVVPYDSVSRNVTKAIINQLKTANPNFLGVILNKVNMKDRGYYGKRYGGYYQRYGSEYGSY